MKLTRAKVLAVFSFLIISQLLPIIAMADDQAIYRALGVHEVRRSLSIFGDGRNEKQIAGLRCVSWVRAFRPTGYQCYQEGQFDAGVLFSALLAPAVRSAESSDLVGVVVDEKVVGRLKCVVHTGAGTNHSHCDLN